MIAVSDRDVISFSLFSGNCDDAPEGRTLLQQLGAVDHSVYHLMNWDYERYEARALAVKLGFIHAYFYQYGKMDISFLPLFHSYESMPLYEQTSSFN